MITIEDVTARQILDCNCRPMVEVVVRTSSGHIGRGSAPTGQTVGMHESFVLRDNDPATYRGLSVHNAVQNVVEEIAPAVRGVDVFDQQGIDRRMISLDGTRRKTRLGGNAVYAASVACLRAAAAVAEKPVFQHIARQPLETLPVPSFNVINGGRHGGILQPFNEFLLVPYGAEDIFEAVEMGVTLFDELGKLITKFAGSAGTAKSYGYAAPSADPRTVLALMQETAALCGWEDKVGFALDCASSEMYNAADDTYHLHGRRADRTELVGFVQELTEEFDLVFVEDLLDENDWEGFKLAKRELSRTVILGDDLIVTDRARLQRAIDEDAVGGFLLKPNQIGTITEALETYETAQRNNLVTVPSGRSGGAIDDIVMDLSVGLGVPFQKNGAPRSGERIEKLNFLLRAAAAIPRGRLADLSLLPGRTRNLDLVGAAG
jgi:enolase